MCLPGRPFARALALVGIVTFAPAVRASADDSPPNDAPPAPARTTVKAPELEAWQTGKVERRGGIVLALQAGAGLASTTGYPAKVTKVDDPAYYAKSGTLYGTTSSLLVMAALVDYLNFGIFMTSGRYENSAVDVRSFGGGVRVEAYPFYSRGRGWRDLAVYASFGLGGSKLEAKNNPLSLGAEGVQSFVGVGALYEWSFGHLFGGHFAGGPSLGYDAIFSSSIEQHAVSLTGRIAYYGGP